MQVHFGVFFEMQCNESYFAVQQSSFPVIHKVDNVDNCVQSSSHENTLEVVN